MQEILITVSEIICEHIQAWERHLRSTRPFSNQIEELCLQVVNTLKNYPETTVKDGICTMTSLNHMINLHKNKAEKKHLKTWNKETSSEDEEMEDEDEMKEEEE